MTPEITDRQVRFLADRLGPPGATRVLDLACGNGRHAVGLSKRGFRTTGLDLNRFLLAQARMQSSASAPTDWVRADMRRLPFENAFAAVLCLFTSFGFFDDASDDLAVLDGVRRALEPRGVFILDVMNREFVLSRYSGHEVLAGDDGSVSTHRRRFEPSTGVFRHERTRVDDAGRVERWETAVRLYSRAELESLLDGSGFRILETHGGYGPQEPGRDHPRTILIAEQRR